MPPSPPKPHRSILLISAAQQQTCFLNVLETVLHCYCAIDSSTCFSKFMHLATAAVSMLSELAAFHHYPCFVICCCFCFFWGVFGQSICMGRPLSEPSELREGLCSEPHSVLAAMLPHKSLLFIYLSCPGEMLLQRGERFSPDHGQLWMCVRVRVCTEVIEGAC